MKKSTETAWSVRKKGDKVKVYHDPLTELEPDETVTLVNFQYSGGYYFDRKISYWIVKYADGQKCYRKILEPKDDSRIPATLSSPDLGA